MDLEWLTESLGEVDVLAAVVAVLATMVLGYIWYAPQVFGEAWRKEAGLSKKEMEDTEGMPAMYAGMIVLNLFTVWFLGATLIGTGTIVVMDAAILGAVFGMVFAAFPHATHAFFERKSLTYIAIGGGHHIANFTVMALVLAAFGLGN